MRPRYYCDHCNKGGGSGGHMRKHEAACTKNPARVCGMCKLIPQEQPNLESLVALLPTVEQQKEVVRADGGYQSFDSFQPIPSSVVDALRDAAGGCPACMLAAIRQRGLPVATAIGFDFTADCKEIWSDVNERGQHPDRNSTAYY